MLAWTVPPEDARDPIRAARTRRNSGVRPHARTQHVKCRTCVTHTRQKAQRTAAGAANTKLTCSCFRELAASTALAAGEAAAQLQPQHVILGGWPPRSKKELIITDIDRLWEGLPKTTRDKMVRPCAGRVRLDCEDEGATAVARHMSLRVTAFAGQVEEGGLRRTKVGCG